MPNWVLGNNVFTSSTIQFDLTAGNTTKQFPPSLVKTSTGTLYDMMWQSGVVKGFNVYIGTNTATVDIDMLMWRGIYDDISQHPHTATTLFTVPAGETGYFCFDETTLTRAQRTWVKRDLMSFRWNRSNTVNGITGITYAICLEMTEEYLKTNDWDDTAEPPILNKVVSRD